MTLAPVVAGNVPIRAPAAAFLAGFERRVVTGLLTGRPHPRSNYVVTRAGPGQLHVSAGDWWTALNVGLNELDLQIPQTGLVHYHVRYWRWASYALGLSAALGAMGLTLLLFTDVRSYIARHPSRMMPGLSADQNLLLGWVMVLFWGFAWPWLLIVLHQRPLRRLVERLISEVDAAVAPVGPR